MKNVEQRYFDPNLVVKALRDSGYKDTYHALAELIDNSIQAGSTQLHVYLFSELQNNNIRAGERIVKIAVLDDGTGMDKDILIKAVKFGDGTRLAGERGLGKFGMGLPSSSISQCKELHVWSWQNGVDAALKTNLSVAAIQAGNDFVPEPTNKPIDGDVSVLASKLLKRKGTLVVWEELDRLSPKRWSAFVANLEFVIGRKYRKFIHSGKVAIIVHDVYEKKERSQVTIEVIDPLYLMAPTKTPRPYDQEPLFVEYLHFPEPVRTLSFNGRSGQVRVKVSHVRPGLRKAYFDANSQDAGNSDFGKHAAKNVGVSVLREGRELELYKEFAKPSEPRERWWGLEIDFDQDLDELFRVTTNKQSALAVDDFKNFDWKDEAFDNETLSAYLERIAEETPGRQQLVRLFHDIAECLNAIRQSLRIEGTRSGDKDPDATRAGAEAIATKVAKEREKDGNEGETFKDPLPGVEDLQKVADEEGIPQTGLVHLEEVVLRQNRFGIEVGHNPESQSFFVVRPTRGTIVVVINSAHPFYSQVWEPIFGIHDLADDAMSDAEKVNRAQIAFKLTLIAWARLEDESKNDAERMRLIRGDWGRLLSDFLRDLRDPAESQLLI